MLGTRNADRRRSRHIKRFMIRSLVSQDEHLTLYREGVNPHLPGTAEHAHYNHQIWCKRFYRSAQKNQITLENELDTNTSYAAEMSIPNLLQLKSEIKSMTDQLKDQLEITNLELSIREREVNIPKIFQDIQFARAAEIRAQVAEQRDQEEKEASVSKIKQEMEFARAEKTRKQQLHEVRLKRELVHLEKEEIELANLKKEGEKKD